MTTPEKPPTLVDLAALDEAAGKDPWTFTVLNEDYDEPENEYKASAWVDSVDTVAGSEGDYMHVPAARFTAAAKGFAPRLLAELRALPRYDRQGVSEESQWMPRDPNGDWIKVSDLRALLGEAQ